MVSGIATVSVDGVDNTPVLDISAAPFGMAPPYSVMISADTTALPASYANIAVTPPSNAPSAADDAFWEGLVRQTANGDWFEYFIPTGLISGMSAPVFNHPTYGSIYVARLFGGGVWGQFATNIFGSANGGYGVFLPGTFAALDTAARRQAILDQIALAGGTWI